MRLVAHLHLQPDQPAWLHQVRPVHAAIHGNPTRGLDHRSNPLRIHGTEAATIRALIEADIHYPGGPTIHKRDVFGMEGSFELIHLGHAFEHMPEPLQVLVRLRELLARGGTAVIRIPVADSYAWRHYGTEWVQLDAPRHLFLNTRSSMQRLAEQAGLELIAEQRDSTVFQFEGSEKYRLGLLLDAPDPFTAAQRKAWARHAHALNAEGTGDTATFHLRRPQ